MDRRQPVRRAIGAVMRLFMVLIAMQITAMPAFAQGGNPLDPPKKPTFKTPSYFEGDGLIMAIERFDAKAQTVEGRLMMGDRVFPFTAKQDLERMFSGTFKVGDDAFAFSAWQVTDGTMNFETGETAYKLQPVEKPSRAFPGDAKPAPKNPLEEKPAAQAKANSLAGTWTGTGKDEFDDGTPLTFPVTIKMTEANDGALTADFHSTVPFPVGQGQTVNVEVRGRFTGRASASGAIELNADNVTVSANGESQSIGAQSMRLQPKGANQLTGMVGNDFEGWTPIELKREGGAATTTTTTGGSTKPADPGVPHANIANLPATIVFEKVTLRDPGMDNMVSHTLLVPQGWRVEGGQQWNPQTFRDFVHLKLRVSAGDGRELAVYPGGFYEDSNAYEIGQQMGMNQPRPQPGQPTTGGITYMPMQQSVADYVTRVLMPMNRPQAQNVRVIATTNLDDLQRQLEQIMAPVRENMERGDQQIRQMGGQVQTTLDTFAERVRIGYRENGKDFEEDVWVLGSVTHSAQQMQQGMPVFHTWHWAVIDPRGVRAPVGQLDDARPLIEAISLSIQPDPRYQAVIMHLQHKINMQELEALRQRGEIARQAREEAWNTYQSTIKEQQASNDRMHDSFTDYIRDVDNFQDLDGSTVKLPSLYSHVYSNGSGGYILTNEPTYNPNDQPNRTEQWERINPRR